MTARPPCTQPCKGTHSCALHWGFLQPSPEAAQHVLMETSQRAVSAETALGALDGFIQDCLTARNLAGSSCPTLHSYKTGRDYQQQGCFLTAQSRSAPVTPQSRGCPANTETTRSAQTRPGASPVPGQAGDLG